MNLADIRRKAQRQEAAQTAWEEAPAPVAVEPHAEPPEAAPEVVPPLRGVVPEALHAPQLPEDEFTPPVLECVLEDDLLDDDEEPAEGRAWIAATELPGESFEATLESALQEAPVREEVPTAQPRPAPFREEAPVAPPEPAQLHRAAAPSAPAHAAPAPFNPLAAILKGREEAAAGEGAGETVEDESSVSVELLCFKVAQEEYAVSIMDVKEIIKPRELTEVPRTPPFVGGVLSLRGIIIPVFDLRVRLGLSHGERSPRERIVVVKRERGFCGVLVDQVVQVVRLPLSGFEPPPLVLEGIDRDFVQGIGRVEGRMLILLDMEKVLDVTLC